MTTSPIPIRQPAGRQERFDPDDAPAATIGLSELCRCPPKLVIDPGASLAAVAADLAGARHGTPARALRAARSQLDARDLAFLAPMGLPDGESAPGRLAPHGVNLAEALERIATFPVEQFLEDVIFARGPTPGPTWDAVRRRPRRWLQGYARALGRVWRGLGGHWAAAAGLLDRERERLEAAAGRSALPELFAGLHHRAEVRGATWTLRGPSLGHLHIPDRGLTIRPILGGPGSSRATLREDGALTTISYPLRGSDRVLRGAVLPPADALEALLGSPRASILRRLDQPRRAGRLKENLLLTAGAVTHHLNALEAAGLIAREPVGRRVIVHRTERAARLLGLYEQ